MSDMGDTTPQGEEPEQQSLFSLGSVNRKFGQSQWKQPQSAQQMRLGQRPPGKIAQFASALNQNQLNPQNSKIMGHVQGALDTYQRMQYFRHAGIGAAVRHTLGLPQMGPGMQDLYKARLYKRGDTYHPGIIGHPGGEPEGPED